MPRKRNKNNRIDYRSGGRVQFQPGGTVAVPAFKSQAEFFKEYEEQNPIPRGVGQAGAKSRRIYTDNKEKAYIDYTNDYVSNQEATTQEAINAAVGIAIKNYDAQTKADAAARAKNQPSNQPSNQTTNTGFNFEGNPEDLAKKIVEEGFQEAEVERAGFQRDESGNLLKDSQGNPIPVKGPDLIKMDKPQDLDREKYRVSTDTTEDTQTVTDVAQAAAPEPITAATTDVVLDTAQRDVEVAQGDVSQDALVADTLNIASVPTIDAAEVTIEEGSLTDRVVGQMSEAAKAQAVKVTGQSLRRITRAKEQLRKAGISEDTITSLGNDPEALEEELMDLTDAERGLIEGLPAEALVSTQINSLLEGIDEGEIPTWARPAVSSVEQVLAQRGLSASTVGRDNLFNAIIQSALPIAQSNAQAIQTSIAQERDIESRVSLQEAQFKQQSALQNAQNVFNLDIAQFNADQQTALSNSKFMQTVSLTETSNQQQAVIQDAVLMSQRNLAEADINTRRQIQNAQTFLQMDLTNLNNQQQAYTLEAQQEHQRMLSNQSAANAARQFNATSENQVNQFMAELATRVDISNVQQMNAINTFNAEQENLAEARRVQNQVAIDTSNARIFSQIDIFNAQQDFERNKINTIAAQQIEQSNAAWRRQANLADTAAQNQVNQQNAQNMFNLNSQANAMIWQELRDNADRDWKGTQNERNREADIIATALSTENGGKWINSKSALEELLKSVGYNAGATTAYTVPDYGYLYESGY